MKIDCWAQALDNLGSASACRYTFNDGNMKIEEITATDVVEEISQISSNKSFWEKAIPCYKKDFRKIHENNLDAARYQKRFYIILNNITGTRDEDGRISPVICVSQRSKKDDIKAIAKNTASAVSQFSETEGRPLSISRDELESSIASILKSLFD